METNERLKALRLTLGLTQRELGEKLNVSTVSIRHWELGTKNPSMSAIVSLAQLFKVSTDYLLGVAYEADKDNTLLTNSELTLLSNYRALDSFGQKIVDTVCAIEKSRIDSESISSTTHSNIIPMQQPNRYIPRYTTPSAAGCSVPLDGDDFEMVLVDDSVPSDADFAVIIQGNSMYPYIQDGDTVYIKKDCELAIGDIGIFSVDGAMYCKQYYIDTERNLTLISANPDLRHTNIHVGTDSGISVQCYGKVILDHKVELPEYISMTMTIS